MSDNELADALSGKDGRNADVSRAKEGGLLDGDDVRFNANIPAPLHNRFKELCRERGRNMTSVVKEWMMEAVKEDSIR